MKIHNLILTFLFLIGLSSLSAQSVVKGIVLDGETNEAIIGANVIIAGSAIGTVTDWDGTYEFSTDEYDYPIDIVISYIGYTEKTISVADNRSVRTSLVESSALLEEITIKGSRISEKNKKSPLTIESLDALAIKETPASNFYEGLGSLKGIDLTTASLGFQVINTRGFNSTSPVRSLQVIDGVDNQAPGLNFSLGNFLGSSELDVNKVDIIVGASSAFFGPNAFNGVISMETKDPFFHTGLSASVKAGERNLLQTAVRWADVIENKEGQKKFAYKLNLEALRADDWEAENFDPVFDTDFGVDNVGGFDAVNVYGDEYQRGNDFTGFSSIADNPGLGAWFRTGYREEDLVDYGTRNYKASANFHFRLDPEKEENSPEIIFANNFGSGTTVYQGDNRFSLRNITFLQNRLELRQRGKYFIRAYTTRTGAGDSYDPFFTALQLQERTKPNDEWSVDYADYWLNVVNPQIFDSGFPMLEIVLDENGNPVFIPGTFQVQTMLDTAAAAQWFIDNDQVLRDFHRDAAEFANGQGQDASSSLPFAQPGTAQFDSLFNEITTTLRDNEGSGTKFFDNSALYHVHGEYKFTPTWIDEVTVGSNFRLYTPKSRGTVFDDAEGQPDISNSEYGVYGGGSKSFLDKKMKASVAVRVDKNQNFDFLVSPAASLVFTPSPNNFFRLSFSSAIRNPTLSDQFLNLNVGPAILAGNIDGVQDLVTVESLLDFFSTNNLASLDSFDIAPIRPEKVKTFEAGFRTTLFDRLFVDAGYYFSIYDDFLGFNIGVDFDVATTNNILTVLGIQPFRFAANSTNQVTTQGFSIGLNYYLFDDYAINGNYSWNRLNKVIEDDPIIPAFNTPEHKFNIGISGRNLTVANVKNLSFNLNYKWVQGFLFEGSPQFTGFVPTYDMLDGQISLGMPKLNSIFKIGASNILDNRKFQTYGGPRIGRLGYISWTYEVK